MPQKKETPVNLMEYGLQKKLNDMGMECLYDEQGKIRMWVRVAPSTNAFFSSRLLSLIDFKKAKFEEKLQ